MESSAKLICLLTKSGIKNRIKIMTNLDGSESLFVDTVNEYEIF